MDGMGHGGFARGQTKDLRKGLKINTTRLTGGLLSGYKPLLPASA